jgi:hypothetical protein
MVIKWMFILGILPMGKHGPMNLNKDPSTSPLKKHVVNEHVEEYKSWGLLA